MSRKRWSSVHISDVPSLRMNDVPRAEWKPVRHHLGIRAFGTNAYVAAAAGDPVVPEHDERRDDGSQEHEELYVVVAGRATFRLDDDTVEAPAGTLVPPNSFTPSLLALLSRPFRDAAAPFLCAMVATG